MEFSLLYMKPVPVGGHVKSDFIVNKVSRLRLDIAPKI